MSEILDALSKSQHSQHKGSILELVLVDVLNDLGFQEVRKQQSGSQYGFDVIAYRGSPADGRREVWKFECKNLSKPITIEDIAPKLIWHFGQTTIDRFVIVGPSTISNDLHYLLEQQQLPMPISVWTYGVLEKFIQSSPRAMERLGLSYDPVSDSQKLTVDDIPSYDQRLAALDVVHELNPPYSFDYIKLGDEVIKAFTEYELRLLVTVTNLSQMPFLVQSVEVITLDHRTVNGRVLRLNKMKGIYKPLEFSFMPSRTPSGRSNVLDGDIWKVDGKCAECHALVLDKNTPSGLYHLMFCVNGSLEGRQITRYSPTFVIHVRGDDIDLINLQVLLRHYDPPAEKVLELDDSSWERLKREVKEPDKMTCLGPTFHEFMNGYKDHNWTIRAAGLNSEGDPRKARIHPEDPSTLILDLGIPIDEELHCGKYAVLKHALGGDEWHDIFPTQLKRRIPKD